MRRYAAAGATALYAGLLHLGTVSSDGESQREREVRPVTRKLLQKTVLSQKDSSHHILRLRISTGGPDEPIGANAPEAHVQLHRRTTYMRITRNYSVCSPPEQVGSFDICVKVWPGGVMTPYLADLPIGSGVDVSIHRAKAFLQPFEGPDAVGRSLLLVAFGVGIGDLIWTARRAADAGQRVALVYAVRTAADAILVPELVRMARDYQPTPQGQGQVQAQVQGDGPMPMVEGGANGQLTLLSNTPPTPTPPTKGSISITILSSRSDPKADFFPSCGVDGPTPSNITIKRGRVDYSTLSSVVEGWSPETTAVLSVGGKLQKRDVYRVLGDLGYDHLLLPPITNTSRYF